MTKDPQSKRNSSFSAVSVCSAKQEGTVWKLADTEQGFTLKAKFKTLIYIFDVICTRDGYNVEIEVSCTEMWPVIVHDL